jgi:hypothetical protein
LTFGTLASKEPALLELVLTSRVGIRGVDIGYEYLFVLLNRLE